MTEAAIETGIKTQFGKSAFLIEPCTGFSQKEQEGVTVTSEKGTDLPIDVADISHKKTGSESYKILINQINKTKDQGILLDVALNNPNSEIRLTAINRLTDQSFLLETLKKESVFHLQLMIVKRITDQDYLKEIAGSDDYCWPLREEAINGITDQDFLKEIINKELIYSLRIAAINGITDQDYLKKLVETRGDGYEGYIAVRKITDQNFIIHAPLDSEYYNILSNHYEFSQEVKFNLQHFLKHL